MVRGRADLPAAHGPSGRPDPRPDLSGRRDAPSVRQLASDYEINPLTVAKAYKELSRDGLTDKLRGEGLVVRKGVREALLKRERSKFMKEEWPLLRARLKRLDIDIETLAKTFDDE